MKTATYHISNLGSFAPTISTADGYVIYHQSDRYSSATDGQLEEWAESRVNAVRNAALTEQAEREITKWRNNG